MNKLKQRVIDYLSEINVLQNELKIYQKENAEFEGLKNFNKNLTPDLIKSHMYNTSIMALLITNINEKTSKLRELYTIIQLTEDVESLFVKEEITVLDEITNSYKPTIYIDSNKKIVEAIPNLFSIIKEKIEQTPEAELENYKKII